MLRYPEFLEFIEVITWQEGIWLARGELTDKTTDMLNVTSQLDISLSHSSHTACKKVFDWLEGNYLAKRSQYAHTHTHTSLLLNMTSQRAISTFSQQPYCERSNLKVQTLVFFVLWQVTSDRTSERTSERTGERKRRKYFTNIYFLM